MVKLIRLTSEDNCNFNANLEAGIHLDENASIALQNLTFENNFPGLKINGGNRHIKFSLDTNDDQGGIPATNNVFPPFTNATAELLIRDYDRYSIEAFYEDLQGALNSTLSVGPLNNAGDTYGMFDVDALTDPDRPIVRFKYSPLCLLFSNNKLERRIGDTEGAYELFKSSDNTAGNASLQFNTTASSSRLINNLKQLDAADATNLLTNYIYPTDVYSDECGQWCKGSAFFGCYVYNNTTNVGSADTNGFGIGLSFTDMGNAVASDSSPIENNMRDFEILIEESAASYRYISPTTPHTEQIASLYPYKVDIAIGNNQQVHDRIVFQRNNNVISGSVWTSEDVGGKVLPMFSYTLPHGDKNKPLYPYIWIKGASTETEVGRPVFTPNTISYDESGDLENEQFEQTGRQLTIGPTNNWFQDLDVGAFGNVIPVLNNNRMVLNFPEQNAQLTLDASVWNILGRTLLGQEGPHSVGLPFTNMNLENSFQNLGGICGFSLYADKDVELINSDNYVVILDSNPLESFDASRFNYTKDLMLSNYNSPNVMRGRRLNILATIPKNDNSGYLEFVSQVPTFIDLDNKYPQELKNIKVRVLDKNLQPIKTIGTSIMTLLIQN